MFEVASSDLVNMGITVVSYTLKDIRDEEVSSYLMYSSHFVLNFWYSFLMDVGGDRSFRHNFYGMLFGG